MNNPILKILRFLIFFPICFLVFGIVNLGLAQLLSWFINLSGFWMFIVFIFFASAAWNIFEFLSVLLIFLASSIAPFRWLGSITISILAIINGVYLIYKSWTLEIDYSIGEIIGAFIFSGLLLELTFILIHGAISAEERFEY